jgi:hypothetical protein
MGGRRGECWNGGYRSRFGECSGGHGDGSRWDGWNDRGRCSEACGGDTAVLVRLGLDHLESLVLLNWRRRPSYRRDVHRDVLTCLDEPFHRARLLLVPARHPRTFPRRSTLVAPGSPLAFPRYDFLPLPLVLHWRRVDTIRGVGRRRGRDGGSRVFWKRWQGEGIGNGVPHQSRCGLHGVLHTTRVSESHRVRRWEGTHASIASFSFEIQQALLKDADEVTWRNGLTKDGIGVRGLSVRLGRGGRRSSGERTLVCEGEGRVDVACAHERGQSFVRARGYSGLLAALLRGPVRATVRSDPSAQTNALTSLPSTCAPPCLLPRSPLSTPPNTTLLYSYEAPSARRGETDPTPRGKSIPTSRPRRRSSSGEDEGGQAGSPCVCWE